MTTTDIENTCLHYTLKSPSPNKFTCAIVIQGPRHEVVTPYAIKTYLTHNDDSVIVIVSTYLPENEMNGTAPIGTHLTDNERESIKTGRLVYLFVKPPNPQEEPTFYEYNFKNQNLHVLSTFVGIRYALDLGIPNCLKVRSDVILGRHDLCKLLEAEKTFYGPPFQREDDRPGVTERIVVSSYLTARHWMDGEYHVCDFWYYGRTVDLMKIFNIGSDSAWRNGAGMFKGGVPEGSMMRLWRHSVGLSSRPMNTLEMTARYMVLVTPAFVQMIWARAASSRLEDVLASYEREGEKFTFSIIDEYNSYSIQFDEWRDKYWESAPHRNQRQT